MGNDILPLLSLSATLIGSVCLAYKFYRTKRKNEEEKDFYLERAQKSLQNIPQKYHQEVQELLEMIQKREGPRRIQTIEELLEEKSKELTDLPSRLNDTISL